MRSSTTPSAPIVYCGHTFSISPSLIPLPPFIPILTVTNSPFIILSSLLDLLFSSFLTLYILFVLLFNPVPWKYYIKSNLKGVSFSTWENLSRAKTFLLPLRDFRYAICVIRCACKRPYRKMCEIRNRATFHFPHPSTFHIHSIQSIHPFSIQFNSSYHTHTSFTHINYFP